MMPVSDEAAQDRIVIGLDVGGTKMLGAVLDAKGNMLARTRRPTTAAGNNGIAHQIMDIFRELRQAVPTGTLAGIAIGMPGLVHAASGVVVEATNIGVRNLPLGEIVAQHFRVPTLVLHDVKAAALGEAALGAGQGSSHFAFFNAGTGIAVGLVFDGRIYKGAAGRAGEIGHVSVRSDGPRCACGKRGCLEVFASGPALARAARTVILEGRSSRMAALANGTIDRITAEIVAEAARQGDALALELIDTVAGYLGNAIAGLIMVLDLDRVVVGGGLAQIGPLLLDRVAAAARANVLDEYLNDLAILPSALGADATVLGALAALKLHHGNTEPRSS